MDNDQQASLELQFNKCFGQDPGYNVVAGSGSITMNAGKVHIDTQIRANWDQRFKPELTALGEIFTWNGTSNKYFDGGRNLIKRIPLGLLLGDLFSCAIIFSIE